MILGIDGESENLILGVSRDLSNFLGYNLLYTISEEKIKNRFKLGSSSILLKISLSLERFKRIEDGFEMILTEKEKGVIIPFSPFKEFFEVYKSRDEKDIDLFNYYFFTFLEKFKTPEHYIIIYEKKDDNFYNFFKNLSKKFNFKTVFIPQYEILSGEIDYENVVKSFF